MLNCIKSELYHIFHTKSVYMLTGVCLLLMLLFCGGLWAMATFTGDFPWATTKYAFSTLEADMHIPLFLSAIMGSVVVCDDLKHRTVNNAVAFGLSREQVFLAKLVVGIVASALCLLVTEAALIGGGYLLLENSGASYTLSLLRGTVACIPVWIGGMIAYASLYYVTGSSSSAIWSWLLVMVAVPVAVSILGMKYEWCSRLTSWLYYSMVSTVTPTEEWLEFAWSTPAGFLRCQESGIFGMAIFVTLGILAIRRREL